jgi:hypothetical protein
MMQNQDYCHGKRTLTLDPTRFRCECGEIRPITEKEHRPQKYEQPSSPSIVSAVPSQFSLFSRETV